MNVILYDDSHRENLLPLTFTRPQSEIRIGILTLKEKWEKHLQTKISYLTQPYLAKKYPLQSTKHNIMIAASVCPNPSLIKAIYQLEEGQSLIYKGQTIAHCVTSIPKDILSYCGEKKRVFCFLFNY